MDVIRITLMPLIEWLDAIAANTPLRFACLLLNSISVSFTHTLLKYDHTHWAHKIWTFKHRSWMPDRWRFRFGMDDDVTTMDWCLLPSLFTWYHVFSFLRWPMMLIFVWPLPWIYWILCIVICQAIWAWSKEMGNKDWPNKFTQIKEWLI